MMLEGIVKEMSQLSDERHKEYWGASFPDDDVAEAVRQELEKAGYSVARLENTLFYRRKRQLEEVEEIIEIDPIGLVQDRERPSMDPPFNKIKRDRNMQANPIILHLQETPSPKIYYRKEGKFTLARMLNRREPDERKRIVIIVIEEDHCYSIDGEAWYEKHYEETI